MPYVAHFTAVTDEALAEHRDYLRGKAEAACERWNKRWPRAEVVEVEQGYEVHAGLAAQEGER